MSKITALFSDPALKPSKRGILFPITLFFFNEKLLAVALRPCVVIAIRCTVYSDILLLANTATTVNIRRRLCRKGLHREILDFYKLCAATELRIASQNIFATYHC